MLDRDYSGFLRYERDLLKARRRLRTRLSSRGALLSVAAKLFAGEDQPLAIYRNTAQANEDYTFKRLNKIMTALQFYSTNALELLTTLAKDLSVGQQNG